MESEEAIILIGPMTWTVADVADFEDGLTNFGGWLHDKESLIGSILKKFEVWIIACNLDVHPWVRRLLRAVLSRRQERAEHVAQRDEQDGKRVCQTEPHERGVNVDAAQNLQARDDICFRHMSPARNIFDEPTPNFQTEQETYKTDDNNCKQKVRQTWMPLYPKEVLVEDSVPHEDGVEHDKSAVGCCRSKLQVGAERNQQPGLHK